MEISENHLEFLPIATVIIVMLFHLFAADNFELIPMLARYNVNC